MSDQRITELADSLQSMANSANLRDDGLYPTPDFVFLAAKKAIEEQQAEIERLRREVDIQKSMWAECEAERAKLQAVVDACRTLDKTQIVIALAALEGEK